MGDAGSQAVLLEQTGILAFALDQLGSPNYLPLEAPLKELEHQSVSDAES